MTSPYRTPPRNAPAGLLWLDRFLPLRESQWFRRRVGGSWVRLWAYLLPAGGVEFWHHEGVDGPVRITTKLLQSELWP